MPAVAVIRRGQALFKIIGRKKFLDGYYKNNLSFLEKNRISKVDLILKDNRMTIIR